LNTRRARVPSALGSPLYVGLRNSNLFLCSDFVLGASPVAHGPLNPAPCPLLPAPCSLLPASGKLCPGSRWPGGQTRIPSGAARRRTRWPEVRFSAGLYCHYGCRRASRVRPAMVSPVRSAVRCLGRFPDLWPKRLDRPHRLDRLNIVWGCMLPYRGGHTPTRARVRVHSGGKVGKAFLGRSDWRTGGRAGPRFVPASGELGREIDHHRPGA